MEKTRGDCTTEYIITIIDRPTLKECIDQVISNELTSGKVGVKDKRYYDYSDEVLRYFHGEIKENAILDESLDKIVISGFGSGGYGRDLFIFELED